MTTTLTESSTQFPALTLEERSTVGGACADVLARFGDRFRVGFADPVEKRETPRAEWPWIREVRCRFGRIYPVGGELLAGWTDRRGIGRRLRALPCARSVRGGWSRGDRHGELYITFNVSDVEAVFEVLKPYVRRRLTEEQRAQKAEILARARQSGNPCPTGGQSAAESTQVAEDDAADPEAAA